MDKPVQTRGRTAVVCHRAPASPALVTAVLAVILEMSAVEFAELQRLPTQERRARLGMPDTCTPALSAMKVSKRNSGRVAVLIDCDSAEVKLPPVRSKSPR